jgi:hypothetical protein
MEIMGCSSNIYLWEEAFDLEIKGLNWPIRWVGQDPGTPHFLLSEKCLSPFPNNCLLSKQHSLSVTLSKTCAFLVKLSSTVGSQKKGVKFAKCRIMKVCVWWVGRQEILILN